MFGLDFNMVFEPIMTWSIMGKSHGCRQATPTSRVPRARLNALHLSSSGQLKRGLLADDIDFHPLYFSLSLDWSTETAARFPDC